MVHVNVSEAGLTVTAANAGEGARHKNAKTRRKIRAPADRTEE
jgi:hypothetical protein